MTNIFSYDLHCHTIRSSDAVSTIDEVTAEAKKRRLQLVAITDHGPGMIDGPHPTYFTISPRIPPVINDVIVLSGCEANIIDFNGKIDLPDDIASMQDIVIAGIHDLTPYPHANDIFLNTKAIISGMNNPNIDVIAHPFREQFPINIKEVVLAAIEKDVLLELNISLIKTSREKEKIFEKLKEMIKYCEEFNYPVVIGSDAHIAFEVGEFSLANEVSFNNELFNIFDFQHYNLRLHRKLSNSGKCFKKMIQNLNNNISI